MSAHLHIHESRTELFEQAANHIVSRIQSVLEGNPACHLALAGGDTPRGLYSVLAQEPYRGQIEWQRLHLYFGDERCVGPEHHESNFRMVRENLLQQVPVPESNIHRIIGELPPEQAAADYARTIASQLPHISGLPQFDLVLLGMGRDGHTASLFPRTPILNETQRTVAPVFVERMNSWRISLTLPVLNNAAEIMLLVTGEKKADVLRHVLQNIPHAEPLPVQRLTNGGRIHWFIDLAAAKQL